jgi:hypothetical protein
VQYYFPTLPQDSPLNLLDPALVEANRRGEITTEQNLWLKRRYWGFNGARLATVVGVIFAIGAGLFIFVGFSSSIDTSAILLITLLIFAMLGLLFLPRILRVLRESTEMGGMSQGGLVRQTAGELTFAKGGYQVKAGDQSLSLPASGSTGGLLPGLRYTIYYQEGRNLVLSAEQLGGASANAVRRAVTAILAEANRFSDEDLQANRNGELTTGQRSRLLRKTLSGGAPLIFGLIFALGVLYPFLAAGRFPDDLGSLAIPLVMAAFLLASGGVVLYKGVADSLAGAVESVQGPGRKSTEKRSSGRSRRTVYLYNIGDQKFEVPVNAYPALIDGLEYRASYGPRSRRLLTIEAMDVPGISPFGA